ncbi:uncharacterized protein LOC132757976, partial [Ruditapes philippinarum]|uniref:uncharacterized protein LOC132757976 n=1 Tax=Ruditapes philippinarum TaxID=129788 RepID=UPI00295B500A
MEGEKIEADAKSNQFDIWGLIRRANTTDPYILMAKHRMNKSPSKRAKTTGKLVGRRRRRVSTAESVDGDSNRSVTSLDMYDEGPGDDFDFDAEEEVHDSRSPMEHCQDMYNKACKEFGVHPVANFHNALKTDKCVLRHRQMTADEIKAIAVALV